VNDPITPAMIRAARALLQLRQVDVSGDLGLHATQLVGLERGTNSTTLRRMNRRIKAYYESKGVVFVVSLVGLASDFNKENFNGRDTRGQS
jgi:hypothetical protein